MAEIVSLLSNATSTCLSAMHKEDLLGSQYTSTTLDHKLIKDARYKLKLKRKKPSFRHSIKTLFFFLISGIRFKNPKHSNLSKLPVERVGLFFVFPLLPSPLDF